jgi:L-threonylcarbamoyladenylate synthase
MLVSFDTLVARVQDGGVVSFPTDTVPALAARPDCAEAIYRVKQRSPDKPLILMGARAEDLWEYVAGSPADRAVWQAIARRYFPGALTLVLPANARVPAGMNPTGSGTIGIRVPDCDIARRVLARTRPLATTSANRSGEPPLTEPEAISSAFPEVGVLSPQAYDPVSGSGLPSTVVQWVGNGWKVLRQGAVKF